MRARGKPETSPVLMDVAKAAGVSAMTVSRVINDHPNVSARVRTRVEASIAELGYRPNLIARALASQRSGIIATIFPTGMLDGAQAITLEAVLTAIDSSGYVGTVLPTLSRDADDVTNAVERALSQNVDGIIIHRYSARAAVPESIPVPVVVLDGWSDEPSIATHVFTEARAGARAVTQHLLDLGHPTVWHVAGPEAFDTSQDRIVGWRDALTAAGRPIPPLWRTDWYPQSGYQVGQRLSEIWRWQRQGESGGQPPVSAVFAANDGLAFGVLRALVEAGIAVPGDVSLAGTDDVREANFSVVPLTTIRDDFTTIGTRAVECLVKKINGEDTPERVVVPFELVVRRSTGPYSP